MQTIITTQLELKGTNYEIGQQLGAHCKKHPMLKHMHTNSFPPLSTEKLQQARDMFNRWCPGLNEEIDGMADALHVKSDIVTFYALTYLTPGCSQFVLLPKKTQNKHTLLVRNYEFSHQAEDFTLMRTSVTGKYTHMGSSVLHFGRDEGMNEHGLGVSMSSNGFPVGALPFMGKPALNGLQFWAVIRSLLENCKNVKEALALLKDMPIAYNLNLLLTDKNNNAALFETFNGVKEVKEIDNTSNESFLLATNHPVLPNMQKLESKGMEHSVLRYNATKKWLEDHPTLDEEKIKTQLMKKFPEGLCCHYFNDFFGTTKSIIMDITQGTFTLCWGGLESNKWVRYDINKPLENSTAPIKIDFDTFDKKYMKLVTL